MGVLVNSLIALFQTMHREHWDYIWGSAEKGCVDCSGAFVYAYRKLESKSIIHGSNGIARRWIVGGMLPLSMAEPGMAAFKVRKPGEENYDLPERYRQGGSGYTGDLGDYYHIGLVDNDVRYVLNAKSAKDGFCRDELSAKKGWDFVARLKDVEYLNDVPSYDEKGEEKRMKAKVVLPSGAIGETVNMRAKATKDAQLLLRVPVGSEIDVLTDQGQWCRIDYNGSQGWMMSNYIEYVGQEGESGSLTDDQVEKINAALKAIEEATELIGSIIGRG